MTDSDEISPFLELRNYKCAFNKNRDRFKILVTESLCWRLFIMLVILSVSNRSPTFQSCQQHISSAASVTNIDKQIARAASAEVN